MLEDRIQLATVQKDAVYKEMESFFFFRIAFVRLGHLNESLREVKVLRQRRSENKREKTA